ncbi:methyl-accepting chemotaxis protein [Halorientalis pallida]|uniref:methyl-accepting chemotaxis protein n=1 Tax=Halorientalis pallida TaxID=2479928 RepID=UPI003C700188
MASQEGSADGITSSDGASADDLRFPLSFGPILDHIDAAIFVLDADHEIVTWNEGLRQLTGHDEAEAKSMEMASQAFYHDGRRSKTLADKVLDAPESADEAFGVPRDEDVDYTLYRDTSTMVAADGTEREIEFSAAPLYESSEGQGPSGSRTQSGDGDLVGVVEKVRDRTDAVRRREQLQALVDEVSGTLTEIADGNLDARASFESDRLDDEVLAVVEAVNRTAEQLADLVADIGQRTGELERSAADVAESANEISDLAEGQASEVDTVASEVSQLSATVEEIASTADEVAETSREAADIAEDGQTAGEQAIDVMTDVGASTETVTDDVDDLRDRIEAIDEIVEIINDIADQTNILALNASIEAARAGEAGEGFAVVADEVKQLAGESQENASEIEEMVRAIQADADETVASLEEMAQQVESGIQQVQRAVDRLDEIVEVAEEAADGIEQVSDATDDQAASTEEIASMIDGIVDRAEEVSAEIEEVAAANEEQTATVNEINESLQRLTEAE